MREAPLTDRQATDEALYGSCASRVRGLEVTAQAKDESRTRGGGGATMNSTSTELDFTRRRGMKVTMKVLVIGVLGLAGLLVPVGYVHALDNEASCAKGGWVLCKNGKCGTNYCTCGGKTLNPGEFCNKEREGKLRAFWCDGCSGNMVQSITRQPTLPQLRPSVPPRRVTPPAGGTLQKSP